MKKQYEVFTEGNYYRNPGAKIGLKCTLHGEFNKEKFERSLQKLRSIHPFLTCTIKQDDLGKCTYFPTEDAPLYIECKRKKAVTTGRNSWKEEIRSLM